MLLDKSKTKVLFIELTSELGSKVPSSFEDNQDAEILPHDLV